MSRYFMKISALSLLALAILFQLLVGGDKLRYQMVKGKTYKYVITGDNKSKTQAMGQEMASNSSSYFGISIYIEDTGSAGELTCVAKVDTNKTKIESMMVNDSVRVLKEINGKRVRLVLSPLGKTLKVIAIDTIHFAPANAMMAGMNPGDLLRQVLMKLPDQEIAVGATWKQSALDTVSMQGMKIITKPEIQYKVVGTENVAGFDCLKITFDGTASEYGTGTQRGMEMVIDGTVKSKGTAFFAPKEGVLVSIENQGTTDLNISGTGDQMFTATQSMSSMQKMNLVK